ncbi:Carboxylic ester hydrolase [Pleurotus pulmonarius]
MPVTKWVLSISMVLGLIQPALTTVSASSREYSAPLPSLSSPLGPVINLGYAAFVGNDTSPEGEVHTSVTFYGGIPFAQPPLGNLRFRAPKRLDETIRDPARVPISDARNWGAPCIQQTAQVGVGSEDCLTLNVWKPSNASEASRLPVLVYFHGGGYFADSPFGFPFYHWVAQNQGFIAVSVTYRLNLLGFLGGAAVAADGDMNAGFHDQRAALEWVQRNIHRFGGDPDEVTIAGESAGGGSVLAQMMAYGGSKPIHFKRGIVQSGAFGTFPTADQVEATFKNVASIVGCTGSNAKIMKCLRNASVGALASAINKGSYPPLVEGPGGFLAGLPSRLLNSGKFKKVDFMGGHTTDDMRVLIPAAPEVFESEESIRKILFPQLTTGLLDKAFKLYPAPGTPGSPYANEYERGSQMLQDSALGCFDILTAQKLSRRGEDDVYSFRWNSPHMVWWERKPYQGSMHTSDLYYLFHGTVRLPNALDSFRALNESETRLSREAIGYWTSFIISGNPSSEKEPSRPAWEPFTPKSKSSPSSNTTTTTHRRIVIERGGEEVMNTNTFVESIRPEEIERCNFWMSEEVTAETRT